VRSRILERFQAAGLHEAFVLYSPAKDIFVAHLFYRRNSQINEAEASGLTAQIKHNIVEELVRVGRGNCETIKVNFEFDSHENVEANYEGDYYLRLR